MQTTPQPAAAPKPKSNTWKLIAIVVVILVVVGVAAYILTQKPQSSANVVIQDDSACSASNSDPACLYSPNSYNVTAGGTVTWRNDGGINHTVTNSTATPDGVAFDSSAIAHNGGTYQHTFAGKGTYHYYCTIHPWMKGTINVN